MKYGADYLGGVKFGKQMLEAHPPGGVGGIFYTTFGHARSTLKKMCQSGKFSEIVVHLAPFENSHKYPIAKLLPNLRVWAAEVEAIAKANGGTVILLSPFCEHNHPARDMKPVFEELKRIAPSCEMLNSILDGERVPGTITEIHLPNSKELPKKPRGDYTVSFDGFGGDGTGNYPDTNIQAILSKYGDARHIRCWNFRFNGKTGWKDKTPLDKRVSWPSREYIVQMLSAMRERGGRVTFPNDMLYKAVADDHSGAQASWKDCKALIIFKGEKDTADVLDSKGNVIDVMRRVTPDFVGPPKGRRYYSKLYAYQIAEKARAKTGSSLVRFKSGNIVTPFTDACLRSNLFK